MNAQKQKQLKISRFHSSASPMFLYNLRVRLHYQYRCPGSFGSVCFGPPGSRSIPLTYLFVQIGILPSTGKNKINTLNSTCFWLLNNLLFLKTDVNVTTKVLSKKTWKKTFFCWHLESLLEGLLLWGWLIDFCSTSSQGPLCFWLPL